MIDQVICPCDEEAYLTEFRRILDTMVCKMTSASLRNSVSFNFISQMIPHHQAAIEMSKNILVYTDDREIAHIAENIISTQEESIRDMRSIQNICMRCRNSRPELCSYQRELQPIFDTMFDEMSDACGTRYVNCNFLREMIPHHEGAVRMSKLTLTKRICPQLRPILESIIREQEQGIRQMKDLLCGCPGNQ